MFRTMNGDQTLAFATHVKEMIESGQEILSVVEAVYGRYPDGKVGPDGSVSMKTLTACWEYSLADGTIWNDSVGVISGRLGVTVTLSCSQVKDNRLVGEYARLSLSSDPSQLCKGAWDTTTSEEDTDV